MSTELQSKKQGRKRILSDDERSEKNREKSKKCIRFVPPEGYKDTMRKFVDEKYNGNMNDFLYRLVNSHQPFKDFLKTQIR